MEKKMNYKVCILAAGVGTRMENFTRYLNKALIPVQGKPAISHILEKIPKDIETIVALGHLKDSLRAYIETAYPERRLTFVEVDRYTGPGTGPGYSLLKCRDSLECPFVYESADTLFLEPIPIPDRNWFGIVRVPDTERFCSVKIEAEKVVRIDDKIKTDNEFAFIGLAGVRDYIPFWDALENNQNLINGEVQVSNGFKSLIAHTLIPIQFTWFDTGTPEAYAYTLRNYPNGCSYQGENEQL